MLQVERLHLDHVLQAVSVLEAVVLRSFGPDGGQVLFTRDTGQVMLSRHGTRILTALQLEHPVARLVVECVWKHSAVTGDGSKTFILLLASLLRGIRTVACKVPRGSVTYSSRAAGESAAAKCLAEQLLAFALEELGDIITIGVVPYGSTLSWQYRTMSPQVSAHTDTDINTSSLQHLLAAFFHTRLGRTHSDFICRLTCELLSHWSCHDDLSPSLLRFIDDNFPAVHTAVSGFPVSCSRLIEGQVIHRDFSTPHPRTDHQPIKGVVVSEPLQPSMVTGGAVLELGGGERGILGGEESGILRCCAWTEKSLERVIGTLQRLGVTLLLSAVKQSEAVLALARRAGVCVVECISEEELSLFCQLSGAEPISDCRLIGQEHVATLTLCRPILLGANRYVHVAFPSETAGRVRVRPCSLVVCGPGEGQSEQAVSAFRDALRMLLTTWEPTDDKTGTTAAERTLHKSRTSNSETHTDRTTRTLTNKPPFGKWEWEAGCVITVGGMFEFLLHHALLHHCSSRTFSDQHALSGTDTSKPALCRLLADALLSVPKRIHSHNSCHFLQVQAQVTSCISRHGLKHKVHGPVQRHSNGDGPAEAGGLTVCCSRKDEVRSVLSVSDSGVESIPCKYRLILAVLQCARSLLRVDTVLRTHTPVLTQPRRHPSSAQEDTEEED